MIVRAEKLKTNFYILSKKISEDKRLSWDERGLLIYVLGKPDTWEISIEDLVSQTKESSYALGKKTIYRILNNLISVGYIERVARKNEKGIIEKWVYTIYEKPLSPDGKVEPLSLEGEVEKPLSPKGKVDTDKMRDNHTPKNNENAIRNTRLQDILKKSLPQSPKPHVDEGRVLVSNDIYQELNSLKPKTRTDGVFVEKEKDFDEFYLAYPKKADKIKAQRAWTKLSKADKQAAMQDVPIRSKKDSGWLAGYIPNPATYLNGKRWQDEIAPPRQSHNPETRSRDYGNENLRIW